MTEVTHLPPLPVPLAGVCAHKEDTPASFASLPSLNVLRRADVRRTRRSAGGLSCHACGSFRSFSSGVIRDRAGALVTGFFWGGISRVDRWMRLIHDR